MLLAILTGSKMAQNKPPTNSKKKPSTNSNTNSLSLSAGFFFPTLNHD
jgi:hypothetical protein